MKAVSFSRRGSALLLVLGAVAIMSLAILGLADFSNIGLTEISTKESDARARQLAESGLALGLHPLVKKGDPLLNQKINPSEFFEVNLKNESARLNINAVLLQPDQKVLETLLTRWGMKSPDRARLIDSLRDWTDADPLKRLNGAEREEYEERGLPSYPPNRAFFDLDEMAQVPGMDTLARIKPDWRNYFTVWSDGKLDLNAAPAELIEAVCQVGSFDAENFVRRRSGPDGKIDTSDDLIYKNLLQARNDLSLSPEAFKKIEPQITVTATYRRIESIGRAGSHEHRIAVVATLNTNPIQYLSWNEY